MKVDQIESNQIRPIPVRFAVMSGVEWRGVKGCDAAEISIDRSIDGYEWMDGSMLFRVLVDNE